VLVDDADHDAWRLLAEIDALLQDFLDGCRAVVGPGEAGAGDSQQEADGQREARQRMGRK
jgi:hypothetical protein